MDLEKIKARVAKIPTDDLMMWADNAASGMQRHLDDYRRSPDEAYLGEISLAALTMGVVVDTLAERARAARKQVDSTGHPE